MKSSRIILPSLLLALVAPPLWSQGSGSGSGSGSGGGSGSGSGGTGVDSAVQSYGEGSGKTSRGLAAGLEDAFGGLTIEGGLAVGDRVAPDFALLGEPDTGGDVIIFTTADAGVPVKVVVHRARIASIERSAPIAVVVPGVGACG